MKTYLVFEPAGGRTPEAAERVVFVREKFSWAALLFAPLWLLLNRLWLAFVFWCAAAALIGVGLYGLGWKSIAAETAYLLPSLIVAFESAMLKQFKLVQKGYRETDVVFAESLEAAERRFFARWKKPSARAVFSPPPAPPAATLPEAAPAANSVLGLFPQPRSGR